MDIWLTLIFTLGIVLLGALGMFVGVLLRGKAITHCGASSIRVDGEPMDCPACQNRGKCRKRRRQVHPDTHRTLQAEASSTEP